MKKNSLSILGFTLVEAIITLMVFSVIAVAISSFIIGPISEYVLMTENTVVVDDAAFILERLTRELRNAIPNTVRVKSSPGTKPAIEFIPNLQTVRYQATSGASDEILSFTKATDEFNIFGNFSADTLAAQDAHEPLRLVIYQQNAYATGGTSDDPLAGLNLYNASTNTGPYPLVGSHVVTPASTTVTLGNISSSVGSVTLSDPHLFAFSSPQQKMFIFNATQAPVSFICDTEAGTLTRYWGYTINSTQPNDPTAPPLSNLTSDQKALVSNQIASCDFIYQPGVSYRTAVVTIYLGLTAKSGSNIKLIKQIALPSAP